MKYGLIPLSILIFSCNSVPDKIHLPPVDVVPQVFRIKSDSDTTIVGIKGTVIKIRANSFITDSGKLLQKDFDLTLNEFYSVTDFIDQRLSTNVIDGRILSSAGMIFIEAEVNEVPIKLKEDRTIGLAFKRSPDSEPASLFRGELGDFSEIKWTPLNADTIVMRQEQITQVGNGQEVVQMFYSVIIGQDSIPVDSSNLGIFRNSLGKSFLEDFNKGYITLDKIDNLDRTSRNEGGYYLFETNRLGYLNCDKFIAEELFDFSVLPERTNSDVFVVLDGLNSLLFPVESNDDGEFKFRLPKGKKITVVAYSRDNQQHYFGMKKLSFDQPLIKLHQEEMLLERIKEVLSTLN